jgi:hypothetical protein
MIMNIIIEDVLNKLKNYVEKEEFKGYDPYDTTNSPLGLQRLGKWIPAIAVQIQKRNPLNIRPLLGIRKERNPKGIGLMLKAYSLLYQMEPKPHYREVANLLYQWLIDHHSPGYSGYAWGYNFGWVNPQGCLKAFTPSVVVTAFVADGIYEYAHVFQHNGAKETVISACRFIADDLPITQLSTGVSIAYTQQSQGCCYNASLLGAETLAKGWSLCGDKSWLEIAEHAVEFVLSRQKEDGRWNYSFNPYNGRERKQVDFHQGFILVSLDNYQKIIGHSHNQIENALEKGLAFYRRQFNEQGRSYWRFPKQWPTDIHHQAQGIITFARLRRFHPDYLPFARTIAEWTIRNMQDPKGFFYYQKHRFYTNRISYMRWGQAWMFLALTELIKANINDVR